ncbi:hypothetical protein BGZ76_008111 [Entomortierella beljakovae]|nr:hypothetical protein BGZ76_008111 [Entomortierella beljakovae]
MLSRKVLSAGIVRSATKSIRLQQQTCTFSNSAMRQEQQEIAASSESPRAPYRSPRYLLEVAERQQRQRGGDQRPRREGGQASAGRSERGSFNRKPNKRNFKDRDDSSATRIPPSRFKPQPNIPYETSKEVQFSDKVDWEVSSVFEPRPLYANIAVGRGSIAPLGTAAVGNPNYNTNLPATAYSAHITGVCFNGDLDPEVEQVLIQEIAPIQGNKDKDHRKKSDVTSIDNQPVLFHLSHNFQEVLNPRNRVNQFNNGNVKHVAGIQYEIGSDESQTVDDKQEEKSWKRLERLGGDYSRSIDPLSLLKESSVGSGGKPVLQSVSQLTGQNQSIGLEDKKKLLKAVEKVLGNF